MRALLGKRRGCLFPARAPDQHHETDLRIDISLDLNHVSRLNNGEQGAAQPQNRKGAEDRDRSA